MPGPPASVQTAGRQKSRCRPAGFIGSRNVAARLNFGAPLPRFYC